MASAKSPTALERALKDLLREKGVRVWPSHRFSYKRKNGSTGHISPDLCLPDAKLAIEVDGQHHKNNADQVRRDFLRDRTIRKHGWEVVHVSNSMVFNQHEVESFVGGIVDKTRSKRHRVSWEERKRRADRGDFSLVRLVVGDRATVVLKTGAKFLLLTGLVLLLAGAGFSLKTVFFLGLAAFSLGAFCVVAMIGLGVVGQIYNCVGNAAQEVKETFSKKE